MKTTGIDTIRVVSSCIRISIPGNSKLHKIRPYKVRFGPLKGRYFMAYQLTKLVNESHAHIISDIGDFELFP